MPNQNEQFNSQTTESIKSIFELATRLDERTEIMSQKQDDLESKMDQYIKTSNELAISVKVLESKDSDFSRIEERLDKHDTKLNDLERVSNRLDDETNRQSDRWGKIVNYAVNAIYIVIMSYLLYKMHLQAPAVNTP